MSHLIDMSNDRANVAFVGETPWHGLGTELPPDTTIEEWKIAAGLDWTIEPRDVLFHPYDIDHERGDLVEPYPDRVVMVRSDTKRPLSIMSKGRYNVVQPDTVLEFYRDLVEDSKYTIEVAGCLNDGRMIWALARSETTITIAGQDVIKPFLLFATSCDGKMATIIDPTSVRVVCRNTLQFAVGANGENAAIRIPHVQKITTERLTKAKQELGIIDGWVETWAEDVGTLAETKVDNETAVNYFVELYAKRDDKGVILKEQSANLENIVNTLMMRYIKGDGANLVSSKETAWGLVNAVTGYVDFGKKSRNVENRFRSAQYGGGKRKKSKAFAEALKLAA